MICFHIYKYNNKQPMVTRRLMGNCCKKNHVLTPHKKKEYIKDAAAAPCDGCLVSTMKNILYVQLIPSVHVYLILGDFSFLSCSTLSAFFTLFCLPPRTYLRTSAVVHFVFCNLHSFDQFLHFVVEHCEMLSHIRQGIDAAGTDR
jgi:hypothetical protein